MPFSGQNVVLTLSTHFSYSIHRQDYLNDLPAIVVYRSIYRANLPGTIFTWGQFWPSGIVACVCLSACVSVNPEFVRAINHHAFKLEPLNLDKMCKTTWLRSLLFWGPIDHDLQGQIEFQKPNLSHFELNHAIIHHLFKLEPPNLVKRCKPTCLWSVLFWGAIDCDLHGQI